MVKATQHRFTNDERRVFKQKTGVQISQKLRPYIQGQKLAPEQIEFIKLVCGKYGDKPKVLQQILPFAPSTIYKYCNEIQKEKALGRPPQKQFNGIEVRRVWALPKHTNTLAIHYTMNFFFLMNGAGV
ncbi:hypothetical protein C9374_010343 [Naegleria lovaniensis]|uniref:Uncharacterized protein n=1 Tax=Naegleria lovaniensis TaxID=51637 RepID=A0AA88GI27_NAELO|nr:uncharacterized protein C9374_010343 [Naegleria lovaniensis]KAG2374969.1 hypothetical protein C9374_010343 [Naegleria lovaniensis]